MREENVVMVFDRLRQMKDEIPEILAKKPWITEDESKDLSDKIDEAYSWLDEKMQAQNEEGLAAEPVFTMD